MNAASTKRLRRVLWLCLVACLPLFGACISLTPAVPTSIPIEAQFAFAKALELHDAGVPADDAELLKALRLAQSLAPEWVAPARLSDDLLTEELRGVEALERRRFGNQAEPSDARARYLAARLTRTRDPAVYQEIVRLDPNFAWAHHAFAVTHASQGPEAATEAAWLRSIRLAQCSWERAFFGVRLAEFLFNQSSPMNARELLQQLLKRFQLDPPERAWLEAVLARTELKSGDAALSRVGYSRGLRLLEDGGLSVGVYRDLAMDMVANSSVDDGNRARLEDLLLATDTEVSQWVLCHSWNTRGKWSRIQAFAMEKNRPELLEILQREESVRSLLSRKRYSDAMEFWLSRQPNQVLDADGLPKDRGLRALVVAAQGAEAADGSLASQSALASSLCDVGWFREAEEVAEQVFDQDFQLGQPLLSRALRGSALFRRLKHLLGDVENERPEVEAEAGDPLAADGISGSLNDLLRRFGFAFDQAERQPYQTATASNRRAELAKSPRVTYGPAATLIHPGPSYSQADEAAGRGKRGEPVPGLARVMQQYGRFAVFGEALGTGADGVVLQRVLVEERSGVHLGVPWQGTIAWCDGVDVPSRAQRTDAGVAGAAVHEGYWIDLEQLRESHASWSAGLESFQGDPKDLRARQRLDRAIDSPALFLRTPPSNERDRRRERISVWPALDSAKRLRLKLLSERAAPDKLLGEISFHEIVELTATHEEGHLCDQTRFFPWQQNLGRLFSFALDHAFSPTKIRERLEYRAELVALCELPDPRLALVHLLAAAEVEGDASGLGHSPAYRALLADFLKELDAMLTIHPEHWPELSPDHMLVHQVHLLSPEKVREVGYRLAQLEGLVAPGFRIAKE